MRSTRSKTSPIVAQASCLWGRLASRLPTMEMDRQARCLAAPQPRRLRYVEGWRMGLKSIAIYREGSKRSAPLNTRKTKDMGTVVPQLRDDAGALQKRILELGQELTTLRSRLDQPVRHRMPDTRNSMTHRFEIAGHEGYITVGLYEDGQPGELFITMSKEGSTIGGLMDTVGTLTSI